MTDEPEVLGVTRVGAGVELALRIPAALSYLPDHFPRAPMVPGVVQIHWAIDYGRRHLALQGEFCGVSALKFQHPLQPRAEVTLALGLDGSDLSFAYRHGARRCSVGRVRFAPA